MKITIIIFLILGLTYTANSGILIDDEEAKVIQYDICPCLETNSVEVCREIIIRDLLEKQQECLCPIVGTINYTKCEI